MWGTESPRGGGGCYYNSTCPIHGVQVLMAVSPCNSIRKVVKIPTFHNNQNLFKIESINLAKVKHLVQSSLTLEAGPRGDHSDGGDPIFFWPFWLLSARILPFVFPDLHCSCSQNINLSLIYFPLMSQRKYWGLSPG